MEVSKKIFLISSSMAILIVASSIAYYYAWFVPNNQKIVKEPEAQVLSASSEEDEKPFNGKSAFDILDEYEAKRASGKTEEYYAPDPNYKTRNDIENLDIKLQMEEQERKHLEKMYQTDKTWDLYCASTGRVHDGYYNCR